MIQDIYPHLFSNQFKATECIGENDYVLYYKDDFLLLRATGQEFEIPRRKDFTSLNESSDCIFLFTLNQVSCFLVWDIPDEELSLFSFQEISFFRTIQQKDVAWISILGHQLMTWYSHNRFCGNCGAITRPKDDERAIICPACGTTLYPKISPAIIVAILSGDKILLARGVQFRSNFYSLIAGYADIGESLEDTVIREVMEEVGVDVKNIRYYKSQPWPFSGSMMIGFVAEADDKQPIRIDEKEISEAGWYKRGNLPNHPLEISIAGEMIRKFEEGTL